MQTHSKCSSHCQHAQIASRAALDPRSVPHQHNTANEFADHVADLARRGVTINVFPDIVPVPCDNPLVFQCAVTSPVVDAVVDARAVSFWKSVEFESVDPKSWKRSVLPVSHATRLTCITANVLTMQETRSMPSASERGCNVSGRRAALQLEFALAGASIVGLQETRSKNAFARKVMLSSWLLRLRRRLVLMGVNFGWPRH